MENSTKQRDVNYRCKLCNKIFSYPSNLKRHLSIHSNEKKGCHKDSIIKNIKVAHSNLQGSEKEDNIPVCIEQTANDGFEKIDNSMIEDHSEAITVTRFICHVCSKSFKTTCDINRHIATHLEEKPHICQICGKGFATLANMKLHMPIHSNERSYKCPTCGKSFYNPYTLKKHRSIHTGEKPFACSVCKRPFRLQGNMRKHMITHKSAIQPREDIICQICNKSFSDQSTLLKHIKMVHRGERPHECSTCGKKFSQKSDLNRHLLIHTGEKPFPCDVCGRKFNLVSNLQKHIKKNHSLEGDTNKTPLGNSKACNGREAVVKTVHPLVNKGVTLQECSELPLNDIVQCIETNSDNGQTILKVEPDDKTVYKILVITQTNR